jgi:hypothetical protein
MSPLLLKDIVEIRASTARERLTGTEKGYDQGYQEDGRNSL